MRDADCISEVLCGAYRAAVRDVFGRLGMPNSHASRLALVGRVDLINQGGAIDVTRVFRKNGSLHTAATSHLFNRKLHLTVQRY